MTQDREDLGTYQNSNYTRPQSKIIQKEPYINPSTTKKEMKPQNDNYSNETKPSQDIEQRLADLVYQKKLVENEIFKLPEKQRTLIQINRRKTLEDQVSAIEKEINMLRNKLRGVK